MMLPTICGLRCGWDSRCCAGALLGVTLAPLAVIAYRNRYWSSVRRVFFVALALAVLISLPLLAHYNLLGYRF